MSLYFASINNKNVLPRTQTWFLKKLEVLNLEHFLFFQENTKIKVKYTTKVDYRISGKSMSVCDCFSVGVQN